MPKLDFSNKNVKARVEPLGLVELKYVSAGDLIDFYEILEQELTAKDFVVKILHNQLVEPGVSLQELGGLSDEKLQTLAQEFTKNEESLFEDLENGEDYFANFREAITSYRDEQHEQILNTLTPQLKSARAAANSLAKAIRVPQMAVLDASPFQDMIDRIANINGSIASKLAQPHLNIHQSLLDSISPNLEAISKLIEPSMNIWAKWFEQHRKELEKFAKKVLDVRKKEFLLQHGWIVSPYLIGTSLHKNLENSEIMSKSNAEINSMYLDFLCSDNYQELEKMVKSWKDNSIFSSRQKVFLDCLGALKTFRPNINKRNQGVNPVTLMLPTLIAQIDGITLEYAKSQGLIPDGPNELVDQQGNKSKKREYLWDQPTNTRYDIYNLRLLEDYLFAKANPYGQKDPKDHKEKPEKVKLRPFFKFSRHKIMHGENYRYGDIDNAVRAFLILDFLANLPNLASGASQGSAFTCSSTHR